MKTFEIVMSERCYRFKPDALMSHAPEGPGVYEFVMFDQKLEPIVLFIGWSPGVRQSLARHLMGDLHPSGDALFKISKDIYFDYAASAGARDAEDYRDIAAFLIAKHRPRLNTEAAAGSGRYGEVVVVEAG